jgi:hypothetical protein
MEIIVVIAFFLGGYEYGKASVPVKVCENQSLIAANCPDIVPPADASFGATTESYTSLVPQYRKCQKACVH